MQPDADTGAPGAAITAGLCGHWEHEPPCPIAPHHTSVERIEDAVRLRILFAVDPGREREVRHRIDRVLAGGELAGPDGRSTQWRLISSGESTVLPTESEHSRGLTRT